jgi:hypothetical protein
MTKESCRKSVDFVLQALRYRAVTLANTGLALFFLCQLPSGKSIAYRKPKACQLCGCAGDLFCFLIFMGYSAFALVR